MKDKLKLLIAVLVIAAMTIPVVGCKATEETFAGEITDALQDKIIVKSDSDILEFTTSDSTSYQLGDHQELTIGDTVNVEYHKDGSALMADSVIVENQVEKPLTLEGEITDLNATDVTVSSKSLTATFTYDQNTEINGDMTEGDEVLVTYEGDLSESPHATKIDIQKEEKDEASYEAHGIIGDVTDSSILLSVDSATAYRFTRNSGTQIVSSDNKIEIGDRAEITFTGDVNENPVATKVVVHHQAKKNQNVINGTI